MTVQELSDKLKEAFPDANISAQDLTGGGDHWRVRIVSESFRGKSMIEQHQEVYKALGSWMQKEIHALSLDTSAPSE